jgi:hypothetical protein
MEFKYKSYKEYIAAGLPDNQWEVYQKAYNANFKELCKQNILNDYHAGKELNGNAIIAVLVDIPLEFKRILQDNDTLISNKSLTARGVTRVQAKKLLEFVNSKI